MRRIRLLGISVAVAMIGLAGSADRAGDAVARPPIPKEPIKANLANIRGLNYIPNRPGVAVQNPVGAWRFASRSQQAQELADMFRLGANLVRVWSSMVVWEVEGPTYIQKLVDLYDAAEQAGIWVELVLFDGFGIEPSPTDPYNQLNGWAQYPGTVRLATPSFLPKARAYVRAVVNATRYHPAQFAYDLFNEPLAGGPAIRKFIPSIAQTIDSIDPTLETTVGHAAAQHIALTIPYVKHASFHPYGQFRKNVLFATKKARNLARGKPVKINEIGYEGVGQSYLDTLAYLSTVPKGIGFVVFDGIVTPHQFGTGTGFIGPVSRKVRSLQAAEAFQRVARSQGIVVTHRFTEWTSADPDYIPFGPLPRGWDHEETVTQLLTWRPGSARLTDWPRLFPSLAWIWASFGYMEVASAAQRNGFRTDLAAAVEAESRRNPVAFSAAIDRVVARTAPIIERHSSDSLITTRRGARSVFPSSRRPMQLTAIELRNHRFVRIVGYDAPPNEAIPILLGTSSANQAIPLGGGTLQLNVGGVFHSTVVTSDARGAFHLDLPVALGASPYSIHAQAIWVAYPTPPTPEFTASNGVQLDLDPTLW